MDTNYILGREQISLHNASIAASSTARIAHEGLAAAYGALLADRAFPHRDRQDSVRLRREGPALARWENEGGAADCQSAPLADGSPAAAKERTERHADAIRGHVVQTPEEHELYKVVLEHGDGGDTEQAVASVREGEALIREKTPKPPERDASRDRPPVTI